MHGLGVSADRRVTTSRFRSARTSARDVDGKLRLTRTGLPDLCQNARRPRLPLVEDGLLDRELRPCDAGVFGIALSVETPASLRQRVARASPRTPS